MNDLRSFGRVFLFGRHALAIGQVVPFLKDRWERENGYRQVLVIAFPLVLSLGAISIALFVDRMFLAWYSSEALAASMPAGMLNFALMTLFIGTAGYTNTFVAQYLGAGQDKRIGPVVWQGIYVSLIGGVMLLAIVPFTGVFFEFVGHEPAIRDLEADYFSILCLGAMPMIADSAMAGFFSGRGKAWPVMWINVMSTAVNALMDYLLIFGNWGFPELGINGAAIATVIASSSQIGVYAVLLMRPEHNLRFRTLAGWRFNRDLFARVVRYGLPNGVQFFVDMIGFSVFILLMGRLGMVPLAASNMALNVSILAFLPMIGVGIAVSVLVGQSLGRNRPDLAERSVYSGGQMAFIYMSAAAISYVVIPDILLKPFAAEADPAEFAEMRPIAIVALRFVAVFSIFDTLNVVFASALKGAGDTRFIMLMALVVSSGALAIPSYVALVLLGADIYVAWGILTAYIIILGFSFLARFLGGKWKSMRVIEEELTVAAPVPVGDAAMD
jgi:MATE family multidrug resistance protein